MSSRKSTSTIDTNEISECAKLDSPNMKAATKQTFNQYDNNSNGSIGDQAVNNYKSSFGD